MKQLLLVVLAFALFSCGDDDKPTDSSNSSRIITFSPNSGAVGTQVAITVDGFSYVKSELSVKFNNVAGIIDSIVPSNNEKKVYARVPVGATSGKISITFKGQVYTSGESFTIIGDNKELMPFGSGFKWVYKKYQLDDMSNPILVNYGIDSLYDAGMKSVQNQAAEHIITHSKASVGASYEKKNDQFFFKQQDEYFAHSSWFDDLMNFAGGSFPLPFTIESQWLKIHTNKSSEWRIFTRAFVNETMSFGVLNGDLTLDGINLGSDNINVEGRIYNNVRIVNYRFRFVGSIQTPMGNIPLNLERIFTNWYAPGVGKIRTKMNPMTVKITGLVDQTVPGFELRLINSFTNE